jgi:hypothetical protein
MRVTARIGFTGESRSGFSEVYGSSLLRGMIRALGPSTAHTEDQRMSALLNLPRAILAVDILAVAVASDLFLVSIGDAALQDVLISLGIPAAIVLAATAIVAVARVRAGPLGAPAAS